MNEGDFWNNLDSFVEKQNSGKEMEKVDDWLKNTPDPKDEKASKASGKPKVATGWVLVAINEFTRGTKK